MLLGRPRGRDDFRAAIRIYEKISAQSPRFVWLRAGLIETLQEYASLLTTPADAAEADATFRRALAVADSLVENRDAGQHCFRIQLVGPFNSLAWNLVRRSPARPDDAALAIRLSRKAVEWEPDQFVYWNTLGVAHYRAGEWSSAIDAINTSIKLNKGGTAIDWLLLACTNYQQGNIAEARRLYDRAVELMPHRTGTDKARAADLDEFPNETVRVLGVSR